MNVRTALQFMQPSLELQRSAADEIAKQDAELDRLLTFVESIAATRDQSDEQAAVMARAWRAQAWDITHRV